MNTGRNTDPDEAAVSRAILSLEGLSVGDGFGERFFGPPDLAMSRIESRVLPEGPWGWTDDTAMAVSVASELVRHASLDVDRLALAYGTRYQAEPWRGYGGGAHRTLGAIAGGMHWTEANQIAFAGGSKGNGSAMRSAPIGAYFAGDIPRLVEAARLSSLPTHAHEDACAGAIAIALGASYAATLAGSHRRGELLDYVRVNLADGGAIAVGLRAAAGILDANPEEAAAVLGSGRRVLCEDTVPFALWCADRHLDSFVEAMWATVSGLGDRDTTCAMVGGIVACAAPADGLPDEWRRRREPLPPL
jgi:ADP-ribosylglycohydrolase